MDIGLVESDLEYYWTISYSLPRIKISRYYDKILA